MASLHLGDIAPDFAQDSSIGRIRFHSWIYDPASTGRHFDDILRVIDSLQLTDSHSVATPGNWKHVDDVVIVPSVQDHAVTARSG